MVTINSALYTGRDALMTQQLAISVTGQNIANVNTPGYSRQRVNLESTVVLSAEGAVGTGVRAKGIDRSYDQFLNAHINEEIQQKGRWEAQNQSLHQTEIIFDQSSGDGLSQHMSLFWNSWQDLTLIPSGYSERKALLTASDDMASNFYEKYNYLDQIQEDMDGTISTATGEINSMASQISNLNDKIVMMEMSGSAANDFRDQRDVLMNKLSEQINFSATEDSAGRVIIALGDGNALVGYPPFGKLTTAVNASGYKDIVWDSAPSTSISDSISSGKLKGWMDVRDSLVPEYKDRLDTLARQIIQEVNTIHAAGMDLNGDTGIDFFTGNSASTIQVNPLLLNDVNKIAAAGVVSPDLIRGDNSQAIAISELQNKLTMDGNSATFDTYFNALISRAGSDVRNASLNLEHHTMTVEEMDNFRESVAGVSLDEEMVNLIKFQQGYSAAAKLVDTVKQMMDTVINMV
ncbi:MAG: flagellar hook-associated protein FlgK [Pseudomonadota bacterium]